MCIHQTSPATYTRKVMYLYIYEKHHINNFLKTFFKGHFPLRTFFKGHFLLGTFFKGHYIEDILL